MLETGVNHTTAVYVSEQEALRYQSSGLLLLLPCCRLTTAAPTACQTLLPTAFNPSCLVDHYNRTHHSRLPGATWQKTTYLLPNRGSENSVNLPDWIWVFFLRALSFSSSCLSAGVFFCGTKSASTLKRTAAA